MKRIAACLALLLLVTKNIPAQTKDSTLNRILGAMDNFQERERKQDSVLNHPLGSNGEADYLRSFNFYDSINKALNKINAPSLAFSEQVNLELFKFTIDDNINPYH